MSTILHISHPTLKKNNNNFENLDPEFFLKYSHTHPQFIMEGAGGREREKSTIAYPDEESPCFQQQSWEGKLFWILAVNPIKAKI